MSSVYEDIAEDLTMLIEDAIALGKLQFAAEHNMLSSIAPLREKKEEVEQSRHTVMSSVYLIKRECSHAI